LQFRVGTTDLPTLSTAISGRNDLLAHALFAHVTTRGNGWVGGLIDQIVNVNRTEVNIKAGTWVTGQMDDVESVNGYVGLGIMGALGTVEAKMDTKNQQLSTRSYLSVDLPSSASGQDQQNSLPLRVTLERTDQVSSISLSQLSSFERYQFNPVEDRAPRVLNRVGWTVRMDHNVESETTDLRLGAAWQINRALAVKAVLHPNHINTAIMCKRWKRPRITASFLFKHSTAEYARFLGVGVEVEAGRDRQLRSHETMVDAHFNPSDEAEQRSF
jgi:hypothetical protein